MPKAPLVAACGFALLLCACASTNVANQENLLIRAGFRPMPATTPEWMTALKTLPKYNFARQTIDGKQTYLFADPRICKCVYVGSAQEFAAFRQLMIDQGLLTNEEAMATLDKVNGPSGHSE
ncbi:hypothetical protein [Limobrevibacterium gyesilva]|uniref:Lipoprotein SmpA/OmlA domain-containing protein n=1 Tax=Limobrevibacterium gyesilva TaxID=2991712 RepID=A0AA41YTJ8_9PROT|nr:hypothetical protein [Limobrevibacterium gyesilva]MCW3476303.1 hypothetical protein [Limobrevibacterium gyesilva]